MKLKLTVTINSDVDLNDFLEEDERLENELASTDDEDSIAVPEADLMERFRESVDEGNTSVDDLFESCIDYTVEVAPISDSPSPVWTEKLLQSEVSFVNSIIEQIPEDLGARERFVECLQKLAEAA